MKETAIKVTMKFKNWLASKGKKLESFEDIIKRLIGYKDGNPTNTKT